MGLSKQWAMELEREDRFSICCGAHSIGEIHRTGGRDMGMCADCQDHAEFITLDEEAPETAPTVEELDAFENQINKETEELDKIANLAKVQPIGSELISTIGTLRYNAIVKEHDAHEIGDTNAKQYWRGYIDAMELAEQTIKSQLSIS